MREWLEQVKESRLDFSQQYICIIPSDKMRHAFERNLLEELGSFHRVRFMTFSEWVYMQTEDYCYAEDVQVLRQGHLIRWIYQEMLKMDEAVLLEHQRKLQTARALAADLAFMRSQGLSLSVLNPAARLVFEHLLPAYEQFLRDNDLVDYGHLLTILLRGKIKDAGDICIAPHVELGLLEKQVASLYEMKDLKAGKVTKEPAVEAVPSFSLSLALEDALRDVRDEGLNPDDLYLVYTNESLLQDIYEKIEKYHLPATYANGIPLAWTDAYHFVEYIHHYMESDQDISILRALVNARLFKIDVENFNYIFSSLMDLDGLTTGPRFISLLENELAKLEEETVLKAVRENRQAAQVLLEEMKQIQDLIERALTNRQSGPDVLKNILESYFHIRSEAEGQASKAIIHFLEEYETDYLAGEPMYQLDDLLALLAAERIHAETEKPGHIHISSLEDVGPSYRKAYRWFGMAMEEFINKGVRSAFMMEQALGEAGIPSMEAAMIERETIFDELLSSGKGQHRLYFTSYNTEKRQKNTAILTYQKYAQQSAVLHFPADNIGETGHPHMRKEFQELPIKVSLYTREDYDENIFTFSPSSAKNLLECSRRFMYESIFKLSEQKEKPLDRGTWLAANLRGTLYHELLENYLQGWQQGIEDYHELLEQVFTKYERLYPAIYDRLIKQEKGNALTMLQAFRLHLDEAWELCETEAAFGFDDDLYIRLDEGDSIKIRIRGYIDRVDRHREDPDKYRVIDYKTGKKKNPTLLQIYLYEDAYKQVNQDKQVHFAEDSHFHFIFSEDDSYVHAEADRSEMQELLEAVTSFESSWDDIDYQSIKRNGPCSHCSFQTLCEMRERQNEEA